MNPKPGQPPDETDRILLTGIPRSGSTWLANVLAANPDWDYVHEPDNERHTYTAYYYKQNLPRFPFLGKDDSHADYKTLFSNAFEKPFADCFSFSNNVLFKLSGFDKLKVEQALQRSGQNTEGLFRPVHFLYPLLPKNITKQRRIVKSVHCMLAYPFLLENLKARHVAVIRHPAAVVSSCIKLNNPDLDRKIYKNPALMHQLFGNALPDLSTLNSTESLAGFQVAIFYRYLNQTMQDYPEITLVKYEQLTSKPVEQFEHLFKVLGLKFTDSVVEFIQNHRKEGKGYQISRSAEQINEGWKSRLTDKQIKDIAYGYNLIDSYYYQDFN